jgi:EmrB/QacA subfamily drug resistance transporter
MVVSSLGVLLSTMDLGMMRIALPPLSEAFSVGSNSIVWAQLITFMVGTGMVLTMGKLADLYGRKRVYILSLLTMSIGLGLCSLSQDLTQLLASRFILSIGLVVSLALGMAIATSSFSDNERGKIIGIISSVASAGLLIGPALAGILIDSFGWKSIFYLRIPFSILAMILALIFLKRDPLSGHKSRFDFVGAALLFLAIPPLIFVLNRGQQLGWDSPLLVALVIFSVVVIGLFIKIELKTKEPVLELRAFKNHYVSAVSISHILFYISTTAVNFTMPFYMIESLSFSTAKSGLLLSTIPALSILISPVSGRLSDRFGTKILCGVGLLIISIGIVLLRNLDIDSTIFEVTIALVTIGAGMAIFLAPNTSAIMGATTQEKLGSAASLVNVLRQLGMSAGLAISGGLFASQSTSMTKELLAQGISEEIVNKISITEGMHYALLIALVFLILAFVISILRGKDIRPAES